MKTCPFCKEEIQELAKKCRYCEKWLSDSDITMMKDSETKNSISSETIQQAEQKMKLAIIFAIIAIAISIVYNIYNNYTNNIEVNNPYIIGDTLIFAVLIYGLHKKSNVASLGLLVYFIMGKITQIVSGELNGVAIVISLIFIRAFIGGIQGSLTYNRLIGTKYLKRWEILMLTFLGIFFVLWAIGTLTTD